jgi:hypothetical protein
MRLYGAWRDHFTFFFTFTHRQKQIKTSLCTLWPDPLQNILSFSINSMDCLYIKSAFSPRNKLFRFLERACRLERNISSLTVWNIHATQCTWQLEDCLLAAMWLGQFLSLLHFTLPSRTIFLQLNIYIKLFSLYFLPIFNSCACIRRKGNVHIRLTGCETPVSGWACWKDVNIWRSNTTAAEDRLKCTRRGILWPHLIWADYTVRTAPAKDECEYDIKKYYTEIGCNDRSGLNWLNIATSGRLWY